MTVSTKSKPAVSRALPQPIVVPDNFDEKVLTNIIEKLYYGIKDSIPADTLEAINDLCKRFGVGIELSVGCGGKAVEDAVKVLAEEFNKKCVNPTKKK